MKTDIEIANEAELKPILEIASALNIEDKIEQYGKYKAKIEFESIPKKEDSKLILVTATSPTPFGEGKTTVSIGLLDALCKMGKKAVASLREPSLGPVFGVKGGATGGGYSQVLPMEDINLNFTGDFHAITAANNLLCAAIDNHIFQGNELNIDENNIVFNRCLDVNDRALKNITINSTYSRKEKFDITAASEIMAIVCLAKDIQDLKTKLDNILIAYTKDNEPIFASNLNVTGSMLVILKDAIKPNLVQTIENNPVIIHGGPFANIAHGCSSLIATNTALSLADYCVTEAGFGSDLGALKFFDIKCRANNHKFQNVTVLVTTIKALKYNGNDSLTDGIVNLKAHIDILRKMTNNIVVCLNKYNTDTDEEIEFVKNYSLNQGVKFATSTAYTDGGSGAIELAKEVLSFDNTEQYMELYHARVPLETKINSLLTDVLNASKINYTDSAIKTIEYLKNNNLDQLPICIAKTQYSISDNKDLLGYPENYEVTVKNIKLYNGAGFITIYLGNIITMPGLPKNPNYEKIDIVDNKIIGLS